MTADSPVILLYWSLINQLFQGFNCCFLTYMQVSQETGKMIWYSHLSKNFLQFVMIHTIKGFSIADETEIDFFFLKFPCFSIIQWMSAIWSLVPFPFLNPAWTSGSSCFAICWSLACKILSMTLLAWEMSGVVQWLAHSLVLPVLRIGIRIDLSQSCGHCWVFQIC